MDRALKMSILIQFNFLASGKEAEGQSVIVLNPSSTLPAPTTPGTDPYWSIRLPKSVIPVHYDILLQINLSNERFNGKVVIQIDVKSPTLYIILHNKGLNVTKVKVQKAGTGGKWLST